MFLLSRRNLSLSLLSGASLLLELALTRLFSAVYYPPYVFAILSLAILGIGLGAGAAAWRPALRREAYQGLYTIGAAILAIVIPLAFTLALPLQGMILVLVALPYFFIGLIFSSMFSRTPERSSSLYMADLVGAGLGAILAIPIMNLANPINAILIAAALFTVSGLYPLTRFRVQISALIVAVVILLTNLILPWLKIDYVALKTGKPIQNSLESGTIIQTRWDAFARTDLIAPKDGSPYRLYLDGAAASIMPPATNTDSLISNIGFFPFATNQPPKVLIIGPGGGLDVWFGLKGNSQAITAVEVNPASIDFVHDYASYNGGLYDQPSVRVLMDEGRSVLQRENSKYDLIFLSQVVTLTSERLGYALTENTIYTVEAFRDYFDHLTDKGDVALVLYDEITLTRALSTALTALHQQGLTDAQAMHYVMAFLDTQSGKPTPLLIIGKQPFTHDDSLVYNAVAQQVGFKPLFLPDVYAQPPLDAVEAGTQTFANIIAQSDSDISAPTDNRPFFFQFERGIPVDLYPLIGLLAGIIVLGSLVLIFSQRRIKEVSARWSPLYFAALGVGFMVVEISVIQQTRLFLGHPTLAVTTTIAVLLIGGGIGSLLAERLALRSARWPALGVIVVLILWLILWPLISGNLLGQPLPIRIAVTAVCLLPLALLIGMPFPLGLKQVSVAGAGQVALAWAVNGVMTVGGSIGATALATLSGYNSVVIAGVILYAAAALYAFLTQRQPIPEPPQTMAVE